MDWSKKRVSFGCAVMARACPGHYYSGFCGAWLRYHLWHNSELREVCLGALFHFKAWLPQLLRKSVYNFWSQVYKLLMFLLPEPAGCVWFDADEDLQKSQWRMIVDLSIVCFISPRTTSFPWCCSMFCSASSWEKLLMRSAEISSLVLLSAPVHWALLLCFAPGLGGDFDAFKTIAACPATLSQVHSFVQKTSSFEMYTTAYLTVFVCLAWLSFANFVAAVLVSNGAKCSKCSYLSFDKKFQCST